MKRFIAALAIAALAPFSAACNQVDDQVQTGKSATASASTAPTSDGITPGSPIVCPTQPTETFDQQTFIESSSRALGAFLLHIQMPFKNGQMSHPPLVTRAAAVGTFVLSDTRNAAVAALNNPALCKAIAKPLKTLLDSLRTLTNSLINRTLEPSAVQKVATAFRNYQAAAKTAGIVIEPLPKVPFPQ